MARIWTSASDKISEKIKKARRTGRLDLSAVGITELPEDILTLRSLRSINLSHNSIKTLPNRISMITTLCELTLSHTRLNKVPSQFGTLIHLTKLQLGSNRLTELPLELFALTQLQEVDLSYNQLRFLPTALCQWYSLRTGTVAHNRLESLPNCLTTLTALRRLDLRSNQLRALPPSLGCLTTLHTLLLTDNPLCVPPNFVCQRGRLAVLTFLRNQYYYYQSQRSSPPSTASAKFAVVTFFDEITSYKVHSTTTTTTTDSVRRLEVGREHLVHIHTRTTDRSPRTFGGDLFRASLHRVIDSSTRTRTEEVSVLPVRDLYNGVYEIRFCVTLAGLYLLHIFHVGNISWDSPIENKSIVTVTTPQPSSHFISVCGSPFQLQLIPSSASAENCTACGSGLEGGAVGIQTTFTIRAVDKYGNPTRLHTEDSDEHEQQFSVSIKAPDNSSLHSEITADRTENSLYHVRYTPAAPGNHIISITLDGRHITGSPFTVPILGFCASPSNTLREFQSQFYKELSLKVEIQNLHKKAERRLNKLKKRVEREQKIINELIDQRTKLQNELNSLKSTFKELETECERLEEDTLLYLHDVTIAEWKRTLENKLHNTLKKLEQQIDEQSFLTELAEILHQMLEMEVWARMKLELLRQQLANQIDDLQNSLRDLHTLQLQLETEIILHEETILSSERNPHHLSRDSSDDTGKDEDVQDSPLHCSLQQTFSEHVADKKDLEEAKRIVIEETENLRRILSELEEAHTQLRIEINAAQDVELWQRRLEEEANIHIKLRKLRALLREHTSGSSPRLTDSRRREIEEEISSLERKLTLPLHLSSKRTPPSSTSNNISASTTTHPSEEIRTMTLPQDDTTTHQNKTSTKSSVQHCMNSDDSKSPVTSILIEGDDSVMRAHSVGSRLSAILPKNINTSLFLTAVTTPMTHVVPTDPQRLEYRKSINACKLSFFEKLKFWQSADTVPVGLVHTNITSSSSNTRTKQDASPHNSNPKSSIK